MISLLILAATLLVVSCEYIEPGPRYTCPEKYDLCFFDSQIEIIGFFKYILRVLSIFPCKCIRGSDVGLYVRCENTNLASLSLGLNNIASTQAPIEELTLHKCHISMFFSGLLNNYMWSMHLFQTISMERYSFARNAVSCASKTLR